MPPDVDRLLHKEVLNTIVEPWTHQDTQVRYAPVFVLTVRKAFCTAIDDTGLVHMDMQG